MITIYVVNFMTLTVIGRFKIISRISRWDKIQSFEYFRKKSQPKIPAYSMGQVHWKNMANDQKAPGEIFFSECDWVIWLKLWNAIFLNCVLDVAIFEIYVSSIATSLLDFHRDCN